MLKSTYIRYLVFVGKWMLKNCRKYGFIMRLGKVLASLVVISCLIMVGCAKNDINFTDSTTDNKSTIINENAEASVYNQENEKKAEEVEKYLDDFQEKQDIKDILFFGNCSYILYDNGETYSIQAKNLETNNITDIKTDMEVVKDKYQNIYFEVIDDDICLINANVWSFETYIYGYDRDLKFKYSYNGNMSSFDIYNDELYYIDSEMENLSTYKVSVSGEKSCVIVFMDTKIKGDIIAVNEIKVSTDGKYLFFIGNKLGNSDSAHCWGYINIDDVCDCRLEYDNRNLYKSHQGIILTDDFDDLWARDYSTLSDTAYVFGDDLEYKEIALNNKDEAFFVSVSSDGNIFVSGYNEDNTTGLTENNHIIMYDLISNKYIFDIKGDSPLPWEICEKYRLLIYMEAIHENQNEFSPTGKFEINVDTY